MTTLYLESEVKKPESFLDEAGVEAAFSEDELGLAKALIEAKTIEDFDLGRYKDAYVEKLTALIEAKVEGKEIVTAPIGEELQIVNLMEALKESVKRAEAKPARNSVAPSSTTKKKMAPSKRKRGGAKAKRKCG